MSGLSYAESVFVGRPPEILYDMIADVTRMGEWSPICRACWWDVDESEDGDGNGGPRTGAWFTGRNEVPGRIWETRSQVTVAERGREFTFEVNNGWVRWSYTFARVDGGTELTESWHFRPAGIAGFHGKYGDDAEHQIRNRAEAAQRGIPETLAAIKKAAEAG